MSKSFARNGWPRGSKVVYPSNFVASATPHTKGSWVQIEASTAQDVVGIVISSAVIVGVSATDTSMLLDIGIGAAASEVEVVSNIPFGAHNIAVPVLLPIYIPAGTRVAGRIQGAVASDIYDPGVTLLYGGRPGSWGGYEIAETIGVDTATSGPTTGNLTNNAWDEAVASTANTYRALTLHLCLPPGNTAVTGGTDVLVDIGVGGAGSERVLGTWGVTWSATEVIQRVENPGFVEVGVEAGSRLAIRKNATGDLSAALIGWR